MIHLECFFPPGIIEICVLPVHPGNLPDVVRLFHPSLDLKGIHPRLDQLRDQGKGAQILHAQNILLLSFSHPVRQPAGLGTLSPVPAPASDQTAHQALAGVTVTHGPMNEALHLQAAFFFHPPNLFKRQLSCRHDPGCPPVFKKAGSRFTGHRHLGTDMDRQVREPLPHKIQHPQILDDHCIQSLPVKRHKIFFQLLYLPVFEERIHRQIQLSSPQMDILQRPQKSLPVKIGRKGPGAELAPAQIYRIRTGLHRRLQTFIGSCRSQHFCLSVPHLISTLQKRLSADSLYFCLFFICVSSSTIFI